MSTNVTQSVMATTMTTMLPTTAPSTVVNTCVDVTSKQCQNLFARYNELSQNSSSAGIVFSVGASGCLIYGTVRLVASVVTYFTENKEDAKKHLLHATIGLISGACLSAGAAMTLHYDNKELLEECVP